MMNNLSWKRKLLLFIFIVGLIYMILPGPSSIESFPGLPGSAKSDYPGDTIQNPNISSYFTDYRRDFTTQYYKDFFSRQLIGIPLPIISLNHPPEKAYQYVRDQQESTFLEEYVFPLKSSIFVNGYEPQVENDMFKKRDRSFVGDHLYFREVAYNSKMTLRYYPSSIFARISVYFGIWLAGFWLYSLFIRFKNEVR